MFVTYFLHDTQFEIYKINFDLWKKILKTKVTNDFDVKSKQSDLLLKGDHFNWPLSYIK